MPIKVLGLPGREPPHACTMYRMVHPWKRLAEKGELAYKVTVATDLQEISKHDLIVFQRQEMPLVEEVTRAAQSVAGTGIQSPWVEAGLAWNDATRIEGGKRAGKKVIFDIDDDAVHVPPTNPNYLQWGKDRRKIAAALGAWKGKKPAALQKPAAEIAARARANLKQLLRNIAAADAVTVTTPALAEVYRRYNKRIYVLPNWAEPREWEHVEPKDHEGVHVGWAGGPTHYGDMAVVARPVKQILEEFPHVKLVLCGFPVAQRIFFADVPEEQIVAHPFMAEWRQNLATFDIILAPSEANKFNAGKSVIRLYEGLLATRGTAAVAGSSSTYGAAIKKLGCGYVCGSFADWYSALKKLIADGPLRKRLGRTGYERVLESHTYERNADRWLKVYGEVLGG